MPAFADLLSFHNRRSAKPAFKNKGMQLGAKGAKKQADLLESLGGAPVPEERQSLMVGGSIALRLHPCHLASTDTATCLCPPSQSSQEHDITPAAALAAASPTSAPTPAAAPKPENPFGPIDEEE